MIVSESYAQWFRASTPYIRAHRGRTFVVMLGADAIGSENLVNIVHDLALLNVLGVRLVVVHGATAEVEGPVDADDLEAAQQGANAARAQLEALFTTGIPQSPLRNRHIALVSGNLVTAQPLGVVDGVDHLGTGKPRRVQKDVVRDLLAAGNVVLLPPVGYSASGATYFIAPETLAVAAAIDLDADKLIVYHAASRVADRGDFTTAGLKAVREAAAFDALTERRLAALSDACQGGVERAHLVGFDDDGVLLEELFTAEGAGTQVSDGDYRVIRRATVGDVSAIVELIRPLEAAGALVRRSRDRIERDIGDFLVAELDGALTGCCAVLDLGHGSAELACLVGGNAVGSRLLAAAEEAAKQAGVARLFALTTTAADWFVERGFAPCALADLPTNRRNLYNDRRNAKVLVKELR
ncbi:MAG: amino-acid N-acetyltransferase [Gammaproteobacteria bacterium]|nr:amino-acid N-acetyltransferase [Gammaproteobacteria bacterium]